MSKTHLDPPQLFLVIVVDNYADNDDESELDIDIDVHVAAVVVADVVPAKMAAARLMAAAVEVQENPFFELQPLLLHDLHYH